MIHIVFNESEIDLMKQVIELDETLAGEVVQIRDDYAVGPLAGLDTPEGWQTRTDWWMELIKHSHYSKNEIKDVDDRETISQLKAKLDENPEEQLWIWMGQNQHDVCGYYRMIPDFSEYQGRVMVLKAKKLARPVTLSEFEIDPDEWKKLCDENAMVRMLEGGKKIDGKEETFYDGEILKNLTPEWQKAWRLVGNTLNRMKIKTGDVFIEWRIKQLIAEGKIEVTGDIEKGWKDFDVKLSGGKKIEVSEAEEANS